MRKWRISMLVVCFMLSMVLMIGCSSDNQEDQAPGSTAGIQIDIDFNLNINVEEGKDANGFLWEHNFSEITITGYIGSANDLTVPNTINGKPVTQIKSGAMKNYTGLKSIVIPGSVKSITRVFEGCTNLETVIIEEQGLESMAYAFASCSSLKTVNVPSTVQSMVGAFEGCSALDVDIVVPEGVTDLSNAFRLCKSLKKVTVAQSVTNLYSAFDGCTSLVEVNIPAGVTDLRYAFENCQSLKSIEIPEGITELEKTFRGCSSLENVVLPDSLAWMEDAFNGCSALKTIVLPENITRMDYAFANCSSLQAICIPASVDWDWMDSTFLNCTSLEDVSFAAESYGEDEYRSGPYKTNAFDGCTSLKRLELPRGLGLTGYGCIALEELTIHVEDNRDDYWEDVDDNSIFVPIYDYMSIRNLPALKELNFVADVEGAEVEISGLAYDEVSGYTIFEGGADWYEVLLNEARRAKENGYSYYSEYLEDGSLFRLISDYNEDTSWITNQIPVTTIESRARVGNQIIYTCYSPAVVDDGQTPAVVCYKSVQSDYIQVSRVDVDEVYEEVCGTEMYADCEYNESITINGVSYPVELYADS